MSQLNGARRLKSLELHGYKSFASKTVFEFGDTITAVVGPNGSGKSNIADAIRWVLGEQAYSTLRGRKTEDMIFAGSEARPRAGMATATITFDNRDNWLPIDFAEVAVSRRAHRDGENEYLLNGQRVRLRDIQDLLGSVGLAERNYTIIGQGLVDSVLSLRPEERIKLFEEAAGITVHRIRKEEAIRRLDKTQSNLERAKDIVTEIRPRLRSLAQQAERASVYDRLREELSAALHGWYGFHWHRLQAELQAAERRAAQSAALRDEVLAHGESSHQTLIATDARVAALRVEIEPAEATYRARASERENLERSQAVAEERVRWLEEEEQSLNTEMLAQESVRGELAERVAAARSEAEGKAAGLTDRTVHAGRPQDEVEHQLKEVLGRIESIDRESRQLAQQQAASEARLKLEASPTQNSNLIAGRLREAVERGLLSGWMGELNGQLEMEPAHESAISAALDGFIRGIVFRSGHQLDEALDWLIREDSNERLALLPQSRERELPELEVPADPDCLGRAADLVRVPPEFQGAVELLLGRTLVVRDRRSAKRVVQGLPLDARVVTLSGQVFYPAGQVLVPVNGKSSNSSDKTQVALRELMLRTQQLEAERRAASAQRVSLEGEWKSRLSQELLQATQAKVEGLEEQYRETEVTAARQRERLSRNQTAQSTTRLEIYDGRSRLGRVRTELSAASAAVDELNAALAEIEASRVGLQADEAQSREARREAEQDYTQAQIEIARMQQHASDMERRILEDFSLVNPEPEAWGSDPTPLSMAGLVDQLLPIDQLPPELETDLNRKRGQLRRLGSVDPAAQQEFEEVKGRHDFLQEQIQDLVQAEGQLTEVIQELDELMAQEFRRTFEAVAEAFEGFFVRLFAGGSARLEYLGEEGIEIQVKLPGHRNQGLAMLSGGERSLTAVALVFALLRLSPTPFCVLDEVDAMLDERNVERFGLILRELSERTQFLVITHNRQTIQAAEVLYGISLGRDNSSDVISLRLDQVEERIAA